jgi:hypothetical protein
MPEKKGWKDSLGFDSPRGDDAPHEGGSDAPGGDVSERGSERVRVTAVVAVAVAVGLLVWLLFIRGGDDSTSAGNENPAEAQQVSVVSESELLGALKGVGYPVYWAGPRVEVEYEVSRPSSDRTFIRYLPKGEEAGTEKQFLTVGSYQQSDALSRIQELGEEPGAVLVQVAGGGSAYAEGPEATSAYLSFPGVETQIEVFDPQGGEALELIRSGAIVPVG